MDFEFTNSYRSISKIQRKSRNNIDRCYFTELGVEGTLSLSRPTFSIGPCVIPSSSLNPVRFGHGIGF
ncbi:hypothetical protein COLO4_04667 [Corchorus olitorius]|uniref:Uncharacterized protein n=1 Tax=Corchorus olitorius TaxID=93759 RepID=A0A1R3KT91_9ROSI|nr:hypothetical protein COLO4_04667 [Corchorus olitorius]